MKKYLIHNLLLGAILVSSLSACLKDDSQPDFTKNEPIIELPIGSSAGNGAANSIDAAFTVSEKPADYSIWVNYAAPDANNKDVVVTMAADEAALTKFNSANGTNYTMLPAAGFTFASNKITIPAGQRKVQFPVKINTNVLDPTLTYALPLTIVDGGGYTISGNFGSLITIISLKNKWDGVYTVTGSMIDNGSTTITGSYPHTFQLITQGPNKVAIYDPSANAYAHSILNSGAATTFGSFSPVFTIDAATNKVTNAVNYYGQPSANNRSARLDASGENAFTMNADGSKPVSFKVKYVMIQGGSDRVFFEETWTYTGSR